MQKLYDSRKKLGFGELLQKNCKKNEDTFIGLRRRLRFLGVLGFYQFWSIASHLFKFSICLNGFVFIVF